MMTKAEFIKEIRKMADDLEKGGYYFTSLGSGYLFGNRNYGEVRCSLGEGAAVSIQLYQATEEEMEE